MKKILSLGVAAAVVSLTAVAASAAIAPAFDTDAPVAGETLTVQVVANGMTQEATTFTVNASEGLTLTANEAVPVVSSALRPTSSLGLALQFPLTALFS